ncbi:transcriptional regulator, AraC family [Paenibacillus curdlanolyticus YK9]|uniref:Transcriptional regulator, AraC family n=1 Tax=Paenibacillus curdlanolyticus YK9 TaxID=717606 RepID=E0IA11_9BACL|nr:AraC family transcriptional regulator [Paenibacillus curdlanolyticus]EFM10588.1 transcriptional regulator, AraC family [Paenibacillus curdlanolyticus YK9]
MQPLTQNEQQEQSAPMLPNIHIAGDMLMKAGTGLKPRRICDYELLYFPTGTGSVYMVEGRTYSLTEPCFIITRPGEWHEYRYDAAQQSRHLFVHFGYDEVEDIREEDLLPILRHEGPSCIPLGDEWLASLMTQLMNIAYAHPTRMQQRGSALLLTLLEELNAAYVEYPVERVAAIPAQITKAIRYIEEHLEEPFTVEGLAEQAGWTHEHFTRLFARHTGRTPREMIIQRRIERACHLLLYEDATVKEVAFSVGFADENYFCRVFKSLKGITATQYRKKYYNPKHRGLNAVIQDDTSCSPNRVLIFPATS